MPQSRSLIVSLIFLSLVALLHSGSLLAANVIIPSSPDLDAKSYLLMDFDSGEILANKSPDMRLSPASLTKIMTAYVVFREIASGHLGLDDLVTVSEKAWRTPGSRMFIEVNKQVSISDLLHGMIIQSGNDSSVALAEHVAGDEATFAELMNQHAQRLGMVNSHFENSTGLPHDNHFTTAHDLGILTRALIAETPEYYRWHAIKEFTYNGITQKNRNKLLWRDSTVDGVKTGHTEDAGYCLVASAVRDDMRLISVVMGTKSVEARANENQALLNYGYRFFKTHRLYRAGEVLTHSRIWKGAQETIPLGLTEDLYVTIPRKQFDQLDAKLTIDSRIIAPITSGQTLGRVRITLQNEEIANLPLTALGTVEEGSIFQRLTDEALLLIQ